tara:strand:+ start:2150 stop:3283 length:1134 start_codon:yes stop_codon:yes gene_type:complete
MYIRNQKYLISISICVGAIVTIMFLFSGLAFDSITYLSQSEPGGSQGSWLYFGNQKSIIDRTNITFLFIFPFSLLGVHIGGTLYILLATYLLRLVYRFVFTFRGNNQSKLEDLFILFPYYIAYILLPGKESIVFFGIILIFYLCNILNQSIALNDIKYSNTNTLILIITILITCLIRPPLILILAPGILISFPFIRKIILSYIRQKINFSYLIIFSLIIGALILGITTLLFNPSYYSEAIIGITKMTTFSQGTLSTNIINYQIVNNLELILPLTLSTFLIGFPIIPNTTENILSIIFGSYYGLTNIYLYFIIYKKTKFSKDIAIIALLFIPILIGGYILSVGLSFNTGTGLRYSLPYVEILWLISSIKPKQKLISVN